MQPGLHLPRYGARGGHGGGGLSGGLVLLGPGLGARAVRSRGALPPALHQRICAMPASRLLRHPGGPPGLPAGFLLPGALRDAVGVSCGALWQRAWALYRRVQRGVRAWDVEQRHRCYLAGVHPLCSWPILLHAAGTGGLPRRHVLSREGDGTD